MKFDELDQSLTIAADSAPRPAKIFDNSARENFCKTSNRSDIKEARSIASSNRVSKKSTASFASFLYHLTLVTQS
jgi:hypothetical protein